MITTSELLGVLSLVLFLQPQWIFLIVHDLEDGASMVRWLAAS